MLTNHKNNQLQNKLIVQKYTNMSPHPFSLLWSYTNLLHDVAYCYTLSLNIRDPDTCYFIVLHVVTQCFILLHVVTPCHLTLETVTCAAFIVLLLLHCVTLYLIIMDFITDSKFVNASFHPISVLKIVCVTLVTLLQHSYRQGDVKLHVPNHGTEWN